MTTESRKSHLFALAALIAIAFTTALIISGLAGIFIDLMSDLVNALLAR